jgi:hypothetical protein
VDRKVFYRGSWMLSIAFSYLFRLLTRGENLELNCITMHSHTDSEYRILAFAGMLADIFLSMVASSAIYSKSFRWFRMVLVLLHYHPVGIDFHSCFMSVEVYIFTSSGNRSMEVYA